MTVNDQGADLINDLLRELASELDLHYEDAELPAISETIEVMRRAADLLTSNGRQATDVYYHILRRFEGSASH